MIHDQFADRWLLAEFASSGNTLCVYVSQAADPVSGGWYLYAFTTPSFPDYHKWGVWRDAYGMAANESSPSAYAFNRTAMLAGQPATFQRFTAPDLSGFSFQTLTPADSDGALLPPARQPDSLHSPHRQRGPLGLHRSRVTTSSSGSSTWTG